MRRHLLTLTFAGLFGAWLLASDASACCHKRRCAQPTCAPVAVCAPAPVACAPAPCPPKKCGLFGGHKLFGCGHKPKCAPQATICEVPPICPAPFPYAPAYYPVPSGQVVSSGQGY